MCIHIAIYLPKAGRDSEYVEELSNLHQLLLDLSISHPETPIYIRGDMNTNPKNLMRSNLYAKLCKDFNLLETPILHPTYHHFTGNGMSDSTIDVLLHSVNAGEILCGMQCKLQDPMNLSHHDVLVSRFTLDPCRLPEFSS